MKLMVVLQFLLPLVFAVSGSNAQSLECPVLVQIEESPVARTLGRESKFSIYALETFEEGELDWASPLPLLSKPESSSASVIINGDAGKRFFQLVSIRVVNVDESTKISKEKQARATFLLSYPGKKIDTLQVRWGKHLSTLNKSLVRSKTPDERCVFVAGK